MQLFQTFRKFSDGTIAKFGRATPIIARAITRVEHLDGGEVRPLGSLTPVFVVKTLTMGQPKQAQRASWPKPVRIPKPTITNTAGGSWQESDHAEPCLRVSRERKAKQAALYG